MIGSPTPEEITNFSSPQTRDFLKGLSKREPKSLTMLFKTANPLAVDLLSKLICFDSRKRLSCEEALAHPYLKELHCPADEVLFFIT